jgi:hypothetical protein
MRKTRYFRATVAAGATVAALFLGGVAYAVTQGPHAQLVIVTGPDHQRISFVLSPGGSHVIQLPKANDPIRIDIANVSTNRGVQTPSEVFSALVNVDANDAGMSWIGTNSDGTQMGSSTIQGTNITNLVCGPNCLIASLNVKSVAARRVVLKTNAATSIIREKYIVNIWY